MYTGRSIAKQYDKILEPSHISQYIIYHIRSKKKIMVSSLLVVFKNHDFLLHPKSALLPLASFDYVDQ